MNFRKLNHAESFAMVRVVSFPLILSCILLEERMLSAWLYLVLFSTDFIDGIFAFFFQQESDRRARLDSLGDVLFLFAGLAGFYLFETTFFLNHWHTIALVVGLYALQLLLALFKWKRPSSYHTLLAKLAGAAQAGFLIFTLFFEANIIFFYIAAGLSLLDATEEIILTFLLPQWKANIKGLWWLNSREHAARSRKS